MLTEINPKLPMRDKAATKDFYIRLLGFQEFGAVEYDGYLMLYKDRVQIHFFEFKSLIINENYGQVYIRTDDIDVLFQTIIDAGMTGPNIHPPQDKPWGQREFSLLDPDHNLLTFGQTI